MLITMTLNGKKVADDVAADTLLIDFVRNHGCLSVKRGCETANCGLCTVFMDEAVRLLQSRLYDERNRAVPRKARPDR